ncbi:olfactory receptor 5G9-like [Alligator mississippiensis]|uniref:olfactory receptor 5G9-like n=1 Tax=Alligator mississippiensis TaxID=8496 RepID=UPI0003D0B502|nr:olfactory receptor 5G9-like [Alligator mississippiensis]
MVKENCSQVTEFLFTEFTADPAIQVMLFMLFLGIYLTTMVGNLGIIFLIRADYQLHTPMYYFLGNLAFVDICYSTLITPKLMADLITKRKAISYAGCAVQVFTLCLFGVTECILLATMAYDRYVAICTPLVYSVIMSPRLCVQLVFGSFLAGWVNAVTQTAGMLQLTFCGSNVIDLFFCDISPLLSLSNSDTTINHIVILVVTIVFGVFSILIVLISYIFILSTILRIHSTKGKCKAFSTCASHFMAVSVFYGTCLCIYLKSNSNNSRAKDKVLSVFYTVVTPMLNALIYSLRNKEVKDALRKVINKKCYF